MISVKHFFIPHEQNNYRPYVLRHQVLSVLVIMALVSQALLNILYFKTPQVLGFATSISADEIISLTNSERSSNGVATLNENSLLNQAAQLKAQDMLTYDYWAHTNPYDPTKDPWYWFEQAGYSYQMAGENLAMNFDTSAGVINGWLASASHRENLLNGQYTEIGVAVVNGVLQGEETTLVVQLFGKPFGASTPPIQQPNPTPTSTPTQQILPTSEPTPTPIPTPTPTPTPQPEGITAIVRNSSDGTPTQTNATLFGGEQRLQAVTTNLANPLSLGMGRLIMLGTLIFLMTVFMIDSLVLVHKQHLDVTRSHGFVHVGVLGVLVIALVYSSVGTIL